MHEISLLFANYIIRSRQNKVIYLGQSLPFNELGFAHGVHKPDYIFSVITSVPGQSEIQKYVYKLSKEFPDSKILLTGYQVVGQDIDCPDNVEVITQIKQLMEIAAEQEINHKRKNPSLSVGIFFVLVESKKITGSNIFWG